MAETVYFVNEALALDIVDDEARKGHFFSEAIFSKSRLPEIVRARYQAMRRVRDELGWSYPQIGRFFKRDHTTVIYAMKKLDGESEAMIKDGADA